MKILIERLVMLDSGLKSTGLNKDICHLYFGSMAFFCLALIDGELDDELNELELKNLNEQDKA